MTCDFDSDSDICPIEQDTNDNIDWMVIYNKRTPSSGTGPEAGYLGSPGFIYMEATDAQTNDVARSAPHVVTVTVGTV